MTLRPERDITKILLSTSSYIYSNHPHVENCYWFEAVFPLSQIRFRLHDTHISKTDIFDNRLCSAWRKSMRLFLPSVLSSTFHPSFLFECLISAILASGR